MPSQKILYIGNKLSSSGRTVTSIETLGVFLSGEGYNVVMASSVKNKVLRLLDMLWSVVKNSRSASVVLIDTYSTQNFYFAVAVANLCRLLKIPYVPILRGGNLPERIKRSKSMSYKLFNGAKVNVAPSSYLMEAFQLEGYRNLIYIPNTIEIEKYSFLTRKFDPPKLLWVRSFAKIYNPMLAVKVLEELNKDYPEASLCMVGPDKDGTLEECRSYANDNKLTVTFTGKLSKEEWRGLSKGYSIFISTTNFDNTPVSVIEAMALGLPVVSTDVGGVPFLINNGHDGLLVPPSSVSSFVQAITSICENHALALKLAENARSKVENFSWQKVKHLWLELLRE